MRVLLINKNGKVWAEVIVRMETGVGRLLVDPVRRRIRIIGVVDAVNYTRCLSRPP